MKAGQGRNKVAPKKALARVFDDGGNAKSACGNDVYVLALVVGCLAKEAVGSWETGRDGKKDAPTWPLEFLREAG
jgi:hypothetical protein